MSRKPLSWEINGKTFDHVEYEILQSRFSAASPILCLSVQEGDEVHVLRGTLYWGCCPFLDTLRGLYTHEYACQSEKGITRCSEDVPVELIDNESEDR